MRYYSSLSAIFLTVFTLILSAPCVSKAESRFKDGFRGIAWETHKDQLPDLELSKKALKNIYKSGPSTVLFMEGKGNLQLSFDDIPLLSIFLRFNDQQFNGVDLLFKPEDRDTVISKITAESGPPTSESGNEKKWTLNELTIVVTDRELMVTSSKQG